MARSLACCSLCWNSPPTRKDEPTSPVLTKGSNIYIFAPAKSRVPIPASVLALVAAFAPSFASAAGNLAARYLAEDLQKIPQIILETRTLALQSESFCERLLKTRAPDLYRGKSYIKCYNFSRQCEDHFTVAGATGLNRVPFATTFLKD